MDVYMCAFWTFGRWTFGQNKRYEKMLHFFLKKGC